MAKAVVTINIRLDPDMHEKVVQLAASNCRSVNSEVVYRLKAAMQPEGNQAAGQSVQN